MATYEVCDITKATVLRFVYTQLKSGLLPIVGFLKVAVSEQLFSLLILKSFGMLRGVEGSIFRGL